jgi:hypothetical protein
MYIFVEFCSQAKIYSVIALLILLHSVIQSPDFKGYDMVFFILKAVVMIAFTFLINKLCVMGFKYMAWLAAFIPHIIYILAFMKFSEKIEQ